eukprot:scaffold78216_cov62-Phaeocystis_antarctica.AAC.2
MTESIAHTHSAQDLGRWREGGVPSSRVAREGPCGHTRVRDACVQLALSVPFFYDTYVLSTDTSD